jgi:hypothetical protein
MLGAAAALTSPGAHAQGVPHKLGEAVFRPMLHLSHTVQPDATGALSEALTAYVAPLATGAGVSTGPMAQDDGAFGAQTAVTRLPSAGLPHMPVVAFGAPPVEGFAQEFVLRTARAWLQANAGAFTRQLGQWLSTQHVSAGHYAFTQQLLVASAAGPQRRTLYWMAMVDAAGHALYGNPVLANEDPVFLEVLYINLAVADGLPVGWKFDNGGYLIYRVLDKNLEPLGASVSQDLHGAFDQSPDATDPDAAVRCLIDERNDGCSDVGVSVRGLLAATGAAAALVDYVHAVEPKYVPTSPCELGEGAETDCEQAEAAIQYTERTWSCSGLTNKGFFGFRLAMRASRYLAVPDEPLTQFRLLAEQVREALSPTEPFDKFVARSALGTTNPDSVLISPLPQDLSLMSRADANFMKLVVDVGALQTASGDGGLTMAPSHADLAIAQPSADTYVLSTSNTVAPAGVIAPERWATFYVSDPASVDVLRLVSLAHTGPIEISLNGHVVYIGPPELSGGGPLTMTFALPVSAVTGWNEASGYTVSGAACATTSTSSAWCGPVVASGTGNICLIPACGEGGCYGCLLSATLAPWAYYSGNCAPYDIAVGEGSYQVMSCTTGTPGGWGVSYDMGHNGSRWFTPASYAGPYSAAPDVDLKPWLVQGLNVLKIKATPYSGWGYSVQLRSNSCLAQDAGVALPATLPVPNGAPSGYDPCAGGQCSGW